MKINQFGRSMVEMLGVLAIVGILSVGSIAGYSKAMMKYKLNKQAQSFNQFINSVIEITPSLQRSYNQNDSNIRPEFLYKLNMIPDGMKYDSKNNNITDIFNASISFSHGMTLWGDNQYNYESYISYNFKSTISSMSSAICSNLLNIVKENSANIDLVQTILYINGARSSTNLHGDKNCSSGNIDCLKNLNIEKIKQSCYSTKENVTAVEMVIYLFR